MFSLGIQRGILSPHEKNGEIVAMNLSNIIYSTNFELGSFTTGQITNIIKSKGNLTIRDLKKIINPKKTPGMLR